MTSMTSDSGGIASGFDALLKALSPKGCAAVHATAAQRVASALADYHRGFASSGGWSSGGSQGSGGSGKPPFGRDIAEGWTVQASDAGGATVTNTSPLFLHKLNGGTITPRKGKYLTIPMVPEARGLSVAGYQATTGRRLFRLRGSGARALFEKTGNAPGNGGRSSLRAVFALATSATQRPWPGTMPPDSLIDSTLTDAWGKTLDGLPQ